MRRAQAKFANPEGLEPSENMPERLGRNSVR